MKTYNITILHRNGKCTVTYRDDTPLKDFEAEILQRYGTFITLESHEIINYRPNNAID